MGFTETDVDNIVEALGKWTAVARKTEAQYEKDLYEFLNEQFPREKFERQYARGKTRADIYVEFKGGAKVAIELKRALADRGEYHRLVGQVFEYMAEWRAEVVVVLCDENDQALVKHVREAVGFFAKGFNSKAKLVVK